MDKIVLSPVKVKGNITVPSSKSYAHRALIAAALCGKKITVKNLTFSDDIHATVNALKQLGANITLKDDSAIVDGSNLLYNSSVTIDARESGSTLRFMIPVTVALGNNGTFVGSGRLPERPLDDYFSIFDKCRVSYKHPDGLYLPLELNGKLDVYEFEVKGDVSSQFITGLMLCGMVRPIKIVVTTELQSRPYVDITLDVLQKFGCIVKCDGNEFEIIPGKTEINEYFVECDWSQGAFFLCAGAINGDITLNDVNNKSVQGDRAIVEILKTAGADITLGDGWINVKKSSLKGFSVDVADVPDLVPVLAVLSCFCEGTTKLYNASRLRLKESDRLLSMYSELSKLGAKIEIGEDYLIINGICNLQGNEVFSHNDHRVVMSMAVASVGCSGNITINGCKAVNKSYPTFFEDWGSLNE